MSRRRKYEIRVQVPMWSNDAPRDEMGDGYFNLDVPSATWKPYQRELAERLSDVVIAWLNEDHAVIVAPPNDPPSQ